MKKLCSVLLTVMTVLFVVYTVSFAEETYSATKIISNGFENANNTEVFVHCYHNGNLYAGTRNDVEGSSIWKSSDGKVWNVIPQTINGFGDSKNIQIMAICSWKGHLYASSRNYATGTELWRSADGLFWSQVNSNGFGSSSTTKARSIVPYQNRLFVTTANYITGGQVWSSDDGENWAQVNVSGFADSNNTDVAAAAVFDGYLYCATEKEQGADQGIEVWRYDGSSWVPTKTGGFGDTNNIFPTNMIVFAHYLYVGTENKNSIGEIWRSMDGYVWKKVGQITASIYDPVFAPGVVEDSRIYAWGSTQRNGNLDALYASEDGENWSQVIECGGGPTLSFDGSLYISATNPENPDLFNEVYRLTRNHPDHYCGGDISGDNKIGLEEAIHALQVVSGLKQ